MYIQSEVIRATLLDEQVDVCYMGCDARTHCSSAITPWTSARYSLVVVPDSQAACGAAPAL